MRLGERRLGITWSNVGKDAEKQRRRSQHGGCTLPCHSLCSQILPVRVQEATVSCAYAYTSLQKLCAACNCFDETNHCQQPSYIEKLQISGSNITWPNVTSTDKRHKLFFSNIQHHRHQFASLSFSENLFRFLCGPEPEAFFKKENFSSSIYRGYLQGANIEPLHQVKTICLRVRLKLFDCRAHHYDSLETHNSALVSFTASRIFSIVTYNGSTNVCLEM